MNSAVAQLASQAMGTWVSPDRTRSSAATRIWPRMPSRFEPTVAWQHLTPEDLTRGNIVRRPEGFRRFQDDAPVPTADGAVPIAAQPPAPLATSKPRDARNEPRPISSSPEVQQATMSPLNPIQTSHSATSSTVPYLARPATVQEGRAKGRGASATTIHSQAQAPLHEDELVLSARETQVPLVEKAQVLVPNEAQVPFLTDSKLEVRPTLSAPGRRAGGPNFTSAPVPEPPDIFISINRIDVSAHTPAEPKSRKRPRREPMTTLSDYLSNPEAAK